ncbi:FAD/NAD(P)-binding domain-containing protein [Hysterangium stoloniferum]|nr:FAD/NAD(P)-binding domain-containing protein [Hysterangium stoloniferum]
MTSSVRLRVAICGGGIGGLTLALALARYADLQLEIYEGATKFEEIGAGLALWGRSVQALKKLGLEPKLRRISPGSDEKSEMRLRKANVPSGGEVIGKMTLSTMIGFHRAQFIALLVDLLAETGRATTHFGKRCVSFVQKDEDKGDGMVTAHFKDGSSVTCDVLIGCDGIKSAVREELMREHTGHQNKYEIPNNSPGRTFAGTQFSGTVAYRALIMPTDLKKFDENHSALTMRTTYTGKDRHIVTYPVAGGRFINFVGYCSNPERQEEWASGPWVVDVDQNELLAQYDTFEPEVQMMLQCISKSSRWAMYEVEPLPFWSKGRVTILGDAAHAMPPFIGAGGGQGIEDVYVLARLLGDPSATRESLPSVLRAYEEIRRPRAIKTLLCTRNARRAMEYQEEYEDAEASTIETALAAATHWLWEENGDIDDDVGEALRIVHELESDAKKK